MIAKLFLALVALLVIVLVVASTKPDSFRVERTVSIKAPADKIFPYINDLHQWDA